MTPPRTATEEAIQAALDGSDLNDVTVHTVRESDGRATTYTKGSPAVRYVSSSTVKPITCAAVLWGEHKGWLSRESLVVDLVPEFDALATSKQRSIRVEHLLSFTSGLFATVNVHQAASWQEYVGKCAALATAAGDPSFLPGASHYYNSDQHGLASVCAVNASPYDDWDEYMTAFIADTGLFPGAEWNATSLNVRFGGNVQIEITAPEYAAFLRAVVNETVLTPALCRDLCADAIANNPTRTTSHDWLKDGGLTPEDWHFGRGFWLEQRNADWVSAEGSTRISSIGVRGQYAYHDIGTGVTCVISITYPTGDDHFTEGLAFARSVDALLATWGAE